MKKGFTLVEVMVGLALFLIIFLSIVGAFQLALKVVGQSKAKVTAVALLNQKIEEARNLDYSLVGTEGGIPQGTIPEMVTLNRNSLDFEIKTTVLYNDDPYDDLAPIDNLPTDYKRVKVKVDWLGYYSGSVEAFTDISPKGIETNEGGGTIRVSILNSTGEGVEDAEVSVINTDISPGIDVTYNSNEFGSILITGAPTSTENYKISVTKPLYSSERTYGIEEITNPSKSHASVFEGELTNISFSIDELSSFSILTKAKTSFDDLFDSYGKISNHNNVEVIDGTVELLVGETTGYVESDAIIPTILANWDKVYFQDSEPDFTSISYQILYEATSTWDLIPDTDLVNNSSGFGNSPIDLSGLNVLNYPKIKIRANLLGSAISPIMFEWHVFYNTSSLGDIMFDLRGSKILGENNGEDVLKYESSFVSGPAGSVNINNLEWDSYYFTSPTSSTYNIDFIDPIGDSTALLAGINENVILYFESDNSILFDVENSSSTPIFGAMSRVYNGVDYDYSQPTDQNGKAYFVLEGGSYNYEITHDSYATSTGIINVTGGMNQSITLGDL